MSGKKGLRIITVPESTGTCTSRYTGFQVLPADNILSGGDLKLSEAKNA